MTAPTISGLTPISYTEGGTSVAVGSGASFTGGFAYAGGSITFGLSDPNTNDVLALTSATDTTALGAISFDAGNVYLGDGTGRDLIGTVDATNDGQGGQPLTINFAATSTGVFSDSSFESDDPITGWAAEWTVVEGRVVLGTDSIAGWPSPADPTLPTGSDGTVSPGDAGPMTDPLAFDVSVATAAGGASDGARGLRLFSGDDMSDSGSANSEPFGVIHGPYIYSDAFAAQAGDILRFDWKAAGGDDAFDAFGYLLNADTGETIIALNQSGASTGSTTDWATVSTVVPTGGNWQFVFVSGAFDWSGGQKTGGSLYVDNFSTVRSEVNDDVLAAISQSVNYRNTGDAVLAERSLTVTVADGAGATADASADLAVVNVDDAPTGAVSVTGDAEQGEVLTAGHTLSDPDGPGTLTVSYHWERQDGGSWTDIAGATGATYTLTQDDVGRQVRAVATYTDAGGTEASAASSGTAAIANINDDPTGGVTVSGTAQQGQVVTAANTISDPDGVDPAAITYQWQREVGGVWSDIGGATGASYTLSLADVDQRVRAVANYTDEGGTPELVIGAPTDVITAASPSPEPPAPTPVVTIGTEGPDVVVGGDAADNLQGGASSDSLSGGGDADFLHGNAGDDALFGNQGRDTLHGGQGDDIVRGGRDDDLVLGDLGSDLLFGDLGADLIDGGAGDDIVQGAQGSDQLFGAAGADILRGGQDDDFVQGNMDADLLFGDLGADTVHGGQGGDQLFGGDGSDWLSGDAGDDVLEGGSGADVFNFAAGSGRDAIVDFSAAEGDLIRIARADAAGFDEVMAQATSQGADTVITLQGQVIVLQDVALDSLKASDFLFA